MIYNPTNKFHQKQAIEKLKYFNLIILKICWNIILKIHKKVIFFYKIYDIQKVFGFYLKKTNQLFFVKCKIIRIKVKKVFLFELKI